jgi:hypothetical protein
MTTVTNEVYVAQGGLAAELRAKVDFSPGRVILQEAVFAFAPEDEDGNDEDALPSIVEVAMNALLAEEERSKCGDGRHWSHLMTSSCGSENDDAQKKALFAWGAEQILSRLARTTNATAWNNIDKNRAVEAIRRVSLNAFAVKSIGQTGGRGRTGAVQLDSIVDDLELVRAVMRIGNEDVAVGNGLYILASAANHSCSPNAYATFDAENNITLRATECIQAHDAVTISYGPIVGVDGNFLERRSQILASRTHGFVCTCALCLAEEAKVNNNDDEDHDDLGATYFIESYITSGNLTAEEALLKSKSAPESVVRSRRFHQAMSDTSVQSISYDIETALGFQKLALQSLTLRCAPREDIAIAYEIVRLSLLRLFSEEKQTDIGNDVERARGILFRYYGEDYAYKEILDALAAPVR